MPLAMQHHNFAWARVCQLPASCGTATECAAFVPSHNCFPSGAPAAASFGALIVDELHAPQSWGILPAVSQQQGLAMSQKGEALCKRRYPSCAARHAHPYVAQLSAPTAARQACCAICEQMYTYSNKLAYSCSMLGTAWPLPLAHLSAAADSLFLLLPLPLLPAPLPLQLGGVTMLRASLMILNLSSLSALVVVVSDGDAFTCTSERQASDSNGCGGFAQRANLGTGTSCNTRMACRRHEQSAAVERASTTDKH